MGGQIYSRGGQGVVGGNWPSNQVPVRFHGFFLRFHLFFICFSAFARQLKPACFAANPLW
jgi:hypothetical protein